jgi:ABC-type phosphate transport system permease subunit
LAVIPIVFTVAEDALTAVPQSYRQGSIALGATPWQTARRVVLPAAFPGIFAAGILGFGRAIGETMIVLMASGNQAIPSWNLGYGFRSLSATVASELGEVVRGSPHYHVLFFIGVLLFIFTFLINLLGQAWVGRMNRKLTGKTMKRRWINFTSVFFTVATGLACLALTAMVALILGNIVRHGIGTFPGLSSQAPKSGMTEGGIFPAIFGTAVLVLLMTLAAVPLGVSTAIYLQEYAPKGSRWVHWFGWPSKIWPVFPRSFSACLGWDFLSSSWAAGWTRFSFGGLFISVNRPFFGRRSRWRF